MAVPLNSMATASILLICFLLSPVLPALSANEFSSFAFPSFDHNSSAFAFLPPAHGGAAGSAIQLLPPSLLVHRSPIAFPRPNPAFSTFFSFSFPFASASPTASFGFFLTLSSVRLDDALGGPPPALLSLSFSLAETNTNTNTSISSSSLPPPHLLRIRVAGFLSIRTYTYSAPLSILNSSAPAILHSWVDYDGTLNRLQVRFATSKPAKPPSPILSFPIDFSQLLSTHTMLAGFASSYSPSSSSSSSTGNSTQNCTLYEWTFAARHGTPYLMHSQPLDPNKFLPRPTHKPSPHLIRRMPHPWGMVLALIFATACGVMVTFFAVFVWFFLCAHRPVAPGEYPMHPDDNKVYGNIVLVGLKDVCSK